MQEFGQVKWEKIRPKGVLKASEIEMKVEWLTNRLNGWSLYFHFYFVRP